MSALRLTLAADVEPVLQALRRLAAAELPAEVRESLLEGGDLAAQLLRVEVARLTAAGAGELTVTFHPSDRLLHLMATVSAGDGDGHAVQGA